MSVPSSNVVTSQRVTEVDALRGMALFGILIVNFEFFAMPEGSFGPYAEKTFPEWWNIATLFCCRFLCDGKFILIFSFLFGWGVNAQMNRGESWKPRYFRRLVGLGAIGLAHAVFLFVGDILVTYALLGLPLYWVRKWPAHRLSHLAVALWVVSVLGHAALGGLGESLQGHGADNFAEDLRIHRAGSFAEILRYRLIQLIGLYAITPLLFMPQVMGMFCLGLAFAKTFPDPFAQPVRSMSRLILWVSIVPAVMGNAWYVANMLGAHSSASSWATVAGRGLFAPLMTLTYLAIAFSWLQHPWGTAIGGWISGDGRCSLSIYLGESLLMGWIFNSYGLALYGSVSPLAGLALCSLVYMVLLISAKLWLRYFRNGPAEWLLKRFVDGKGRVDP